MNKKNCEIYSERDYFGIFGLILALLVTVDVQLQFLETSRYSLCIIYQAQYYYQNNNIIRIIGW